MADIKAELLKEDSETVTSAVEERGGGHRDSGAKDYLEIGSNASLSGVDYKLAKCCNPVYGDDVFGFVTISEGIKIHRLSCPNAARLIENYPHRVQKVRWKKDAGGSSRQVMLKIIVDEESATGEVLSLISSYHALVRKFITGERDRRGETELLATVFVSSDLVLDRILAGLRRLKNVKQVTKQ